MWYRELRGSKKSTEMGWGEGNVPQELCLRKVLKKTWETSLTQSVFTHAHLSYPLYSELKFQKKEKITAALYNMVLIIYEPYINAFLKMLIS